MTKGIGELEWRFPRRTVTGWVAASPEAVLAAIDRAIPRRWETALHQEGRDNLVARGHGHDRRVRLLAWSHTTLAPSANVAVTGDASGSLVSVSFLRWGRPALLAYASAVPAVFFLIVAPALFQLIDIGWWRLPAALALLGIAFVGNLRLATTNTRLHEAELESELLHRLKWTLPPIAFDAKAQPAP